MLSLILESREHLDLDDLDDARAGDLGRLIVRIERAIRAAIDGVGRVHVHRWGDGLAHPHVWFLIRPAGFSQFRGSALPVWLDVLPALPDDIWRTCLAQIADALTPRSLRSEPDPSVRRTVAAGVGGGGE